MCPQLYDTQSYKIISPQLYFKVLKFIYLYVHNFMTPNFVNLCVHNFISHNFTQLCFHNFFSPKSIKLSVHNFGPYFGSRHEQIKQQYYYPTISLLLPPLLPPHVFSHSELIVNGFELKLDFVQFLGSAIARLGFGLNFGKVL